jgi:hypothetical protein
MNTGFALDEYFKMELMMLDHYLYIFLQETYALNIMIHYKQTLVKNFVPLFSVRIQTW